jgi:hypothetical protein
MKRDAFKLAFMRKIMHNKAGIFLLQEEEKFLLLLLPLLHDTAIMLNKKSLLYESA